LNRAASAIGALSEFAGEEVGAGEKVGIGDLLLADLVEIGGGDAATGGAAGFLGEDVDAVVFPSEIEEAVSEIGDEGALVDEETRKNGVPFTFERLGFPPDLARIGDDAAADAEMGGVADDDPSGQQV